MDPKEQLYYLLEHLYKGNYTIDVFADEFDRIYFLELDDDLCTDEERKLFLEVGEIVKLYSPYESDRKLYPYYTDEDVKQIATEVYLKLTSAMN